MKEAKPSAGPDILEAPEQVLTTLTREGKRQWMYPVASKGRFYYQRMAVGWSLILLFVFLPLIRINGKPAILLDVLRREFTILGTTFFPTDTFLLLMMMIGFTLGIVLFTALFGRVWCGWGCPQTVYLEFLFRPIERLLEGKEHVRKRRNSGPVTFDRVWRKSVKFALYLAIIIFLTHSFLAYFTGWERLVAWIQEPPDEHWGYFVMMVLISGLMFFDFAVFREQMCMITCPYARLQSVLLDADSLIVSYDPDRGEPRARRGKAQLRREKERLAVRMGDCIDCKACVRTCPTGIDIRDGLQMECIACTQCIDACNVIMDKIEKPHGLICYTSENALSLKKVRRFRPRTILYSAILLVIASAFVIAFSSRGSYDINIGRAVGEPFMTLPDGQIANRLRFRVRNQKVQAASFEIDVLEPEGSSLRIVGAMPVTLEPKEMKRVEVWVVIPADVFTTTSRDGLFRLHFNDGTEIEHTYPLLGPAR